MKYKFAIPSSVDFSIKIHDSIYDYPYDPLEADIAREIYFQDLKQSLFDKEALGFLDSELALDYRAVITPRSFRPIRPASFTASNRAKTCILAHFWNRPRSFLQQQNRKNPLF